MIDILNLIGRSSELFDEDLHERESKLKEIISNSSFLVLGGAGTIGHAVSAEIFRRSPKKLHIVDLSENNLVELVRDFRSSIGYIKGEFETYALDINSSFFENFLDRNHNYDFVLNLSALKHVRSEKDPFTLMRMIEVNILNTIKTIDFSISSDVKKYFCVSTDKAANPVNMMGASKRIMEMFLVHKSNNLNISSARFANVAFSDGSLLHGFNKRLEKGQPLVAPKDIRRYFITPKESGELCLMSCIFGNNNDIFFPKTNKDFDLIKFSIIAENYLKAKNLKPIFCKSEEEARSISSKIKNNTNEWPCYFSDSDTTGEKGYEEFFTKEEKVDYETFKSIGIVKNDYIESEEKLENFLAMINKFKTSSNYTKEDIIHEFKKLINDFKHVEKNKKS